MPWSSKSAKPAPKSAAKPAPKKSKAKKGTKTDAVPSSLGREQSVSISVRKIDNGYLTRRSEVSRTGEYIERETFTPSKPKIVIGVSAKNGEEA